MKIKEYIKKNKFDILFFAIYLIISFVIMLYHESWRDEAQSWLIARDLPIIDIIKQMKYEGHPVLWYFIIFPFAKLGFPYITIKLISYSITVFSAYLILKKSPFNKIIKYLIIFSSPFLYFYPSIARSYCLIPLSIALIGINYEKRKEKSLAYILSIVLLANTHIIMLGLVGMLLLFYFLEEFNQRKENTKEHNKEVIINFFITIILLFLTALPIISSLSVNTDVNTNFKLSNIIGLFNQIKNYIYFLFGTKFYLPIITIIIFLIIYEFKFYRKNLIIIIPSIVYQLLIYTFIYSNSFQRAGTGIFIILCVVWIQNSQKEIPKLEKNFIEILVLILLLLNVVWGVKQVSFEVDKNYSNAKQTSKYIFENIHDGKFICPNIAYASALIPYLDKKDMFWNPESESYFTYVTWDENYIQKYNLDEFKEKLKRNFKKDEKLYLINVDWNQELLKELEEKQDITKIYEASDSIRGENFEIYSINYKFLE